MTYESQKQVTVGSDDSVDYGPYIENGTSRMSARPVVTNAVMQHKEQYQKIVEATMGKGFDVTVSGT